MGRNRCTRNGLIKKAEREYGNLLFRIVGGTLRYPRRRQGNEVLDLSAASFALPPRMCIRMAVFSRHKQREQKSFSLFDGGQPEFVERPPFRGDIKHFAEVSSNA